jgi:hypothetical protein
LAGTGLPEKDDMQCLNSADELGDSPLGASLVAQIDRPAPAADGRMELSMRCVASGYMSDGCSCRRTIPAAVVVAAWARELERADGERFFHFAWRDGVWLGYGLESGLVRGLYCPAHSAERDERSFSYGSRDGATTDQITLTA